VELRTATFCFRAHCLHQRVIAIDQPESFVTVNFVGSVAGLYEAANADPFNIRRVKALDITHQH
jgi:hypothetical protein